MSRLVSVAVAAVLISLPFFAVVASEQENDDPSGWQSLHSVVSFRGVRLNMVRPRAVPDEPPPADSGEGPVSPPEPAGAPIAVPAEAEDVVPEPTVAAPAEEPATPPEPADSPIPVPAEAEHSVAEPPVAAPPEEPATPPEPADLPMAVPLDGPAASSGPPASPEACGPLRVRVTDAAPPTLVPAEVEAEPFAEPPAPPRFVTPADCGPVRARIKDTTIQVAGKDDVETDVAQQDKPHQADHGNAANESKDGGKGKAGRRLAGGKGGKRASGGLFGAGGRFRSGGALTDPCAAGGCGRTGGRAGGHFGNPNHGIGQSCACCQMYQHYAYYPEMHGYYYFRPYNWTHLAEHQQIAAEWGEDPRNPYANTLFDQVYADFVRENGEAAETPVEPEPPIELETPVEPEPPVVTPEP